MKRLVVLGGGESGTGAAVLGKKHGWDVFLSDKGSIAEGYRKTLGRYGITFEEGAHTERLILNADLVVKSPGIPDIVPIVSDLREKGIPVISEIEFAGRYCNARTICVTGSNGKTTTTTLIYRILESGGYNVGIAGNIGESFAMQIAETERDWYVLELSSFQLDGMIDFKADIAVITNVTADHLDRYGNDIDNYIASKLRVIRNQTEKDYFIYNADDINTTSKCATLELAMQQLPFGAGENIPKGLPGIYSGGACIGDTSFTVRVGDRHLTIDSGKLRIRGKHNVMNAAAAALAGMASGVEVKAISEALYGFEGIEHRMEYAGEYNGVLFINDSKATNVDSVWYALDSMDRPVIWIAGGTDKGNDYSLLENVVRERVRVLVALGKDTAKLRTHFEGIIPEIYATDNIEDAINQAIVSANAGDVVLLSPACASFDLFHNYEERGRQFKQLLGNYKK